MGCAETEDPPFPEREITLSDLENACGTYDAVVSYARAVDNFRRSRGIYIKVDESQKLVDLGVEQHARDLIKLFLNPWQCRLPNPDKREHDPEKRRLIRERSKRMCSELAAWWERYAERLPKVESRLCEAEDDEIEACLEPFEALCDVRIANEVNYKRKYFGDVAASKTLYILRPHFFVPWDNAIQATLRYRDCGRFYVRYLKRGRDRLIELDASFRESGVPGSGLDRLLSHELAGQQSCTAAELLNKFYWASVPRA